MQAESHPYQTVLITHHAPSLVVITLNRPDAANAINTHMGLELKQIFSELSSEIRAVILTGAGNRAFCAGADLKERMGMTKAQWQEQHEALRGARDAILSCPIPVIAAVNGAAFGGGLELALACDFIYACGTARFALTEATLGIMPGMGGTQLLPRALPVRHAKELLYTGRVFSAQEAHGWGMVNKICKFEELMHEAQECASQIAHNAPLSIKAIKCAVGQGTTLALSDALACELQHYQTLLDTKDRFEGINAFNEKRKPVFTGS